MASDISRSVQFSGLDKVVRAYQSGNVAPWAIFCNTQFLFKYDGKKLTEGVALLNRVLEEVSLEGSPAVYTLKVYEDLGNAKIKSNTPHDGSFNFRLHEAREVGSNGYDPASRMILERLNQMQVRMDALETGGGEEDARDTIGTIERVMEIPGVAQLIQGLVSGFVGGARPTAIAGVPGADTDAAEEIYMSERMLNALRILIKADNNFEAHLEKLAKIAQDTPGKFAGLVAML